MLNCCAAEFRAGAAVVDISPTNFPVLVNAMFTERTADKAVDPLHARALVMDDGTTRLAIVVVDTCMMPRELIDAAKEKASEETKIPVEKMLVSATHTHSAPSAMGCLGSRADTNYQKFLMPKIVEAIVAANARLVPAKVGWTVVDDWKHTFNRRWIRRPDRMLTDPFGQQNVRAHMHPGHQSVDVVGPSGPVDPALSILAFQTLGGQPLVLLANYSQHYYDSPLLSSDYYGKYAQHVARLLNATNSGFVGIMSQGTSGDLMWMDYGATRRDIGYDAYAREMAETTAQAYRSIQFRDAVPLKMAEKKLTLNFRTPNEERLKWAREKAATFAGRLPKDLPEVYALEAIHLHDRPSAELVLQALRVGDFGISAIPNEVFAITGLKLKAQSPLRPTMNIELANGAEGYIPAPEQHKLGGYTTWPARTAGLEEEAEPKIVDALLSLLEEVSGQSRRRLVATDGPYSERVKASRPTGYWRFEEMVPPQLGFEDGVVMYLPGVGSGNGISPNPELTPSNFSGPKEINRAVHIAGGRIRTRRPVGNPYSVEFWFWNGLPNDARPVTGYLFSRGRDEDPEANGDHLGIGGTHLAGAAGKLIFFNGNKANDILVGRSFVAPKQWHYVLLVRDGNKATVYLNGQSQPEISGEIRSTVGEDLEIFFGGRNDRFAGLEGKLDEVAFYDRALSAEEMREHVRASGITFAAAPKMELSSPPLSPEESMRKIRVSHGYRVELAAAEPQTLDPVAIDWDVQGRLWVVEMADYPSGMDGKGSPGGRVRILEDADGDGRYEKSVLFADKLNFPTGIITWRDGVIVTAAPEILFLKDSDGDGRADVKQVLFSGFLEGNQQLRINGLRWGLDNWIYCAVGGHYRGYGAATKIKSHLTGQEIALGSRDFRFRPDTGEFDPQSGPAQFGRNRDDWGRWFGTQNSQPLWHYVLQDHYLRRNPHVAAPDPIQQVMRPLNPKIFPASPQEKRFHSFEQGGHFTSGCSGMIYRDEFLFPADEMNAFACEPFHNVVHREIVLEDGVSFVGRRAPAEQSSEFFASEDRWTRPVMVRTGPDGALWVADMYRYMIEHPDWLPENGREELLPHYRAGDDRGRIYRVLPERRKRQIAKLKQLKTSELVAALDSSNGWQRDKAQQVLLWRNDQSAVPILQNTALSSSNTLARLHALCALDGLGALKADLLLPALADANPGMRENALRLAESRGSAEILGAARKLVSDESLKVRLQLAFTLGEWKESVAGETLAQLASENHSNPYIVAAVMSSALPHLDILVERLAGIERYGESLQTMALAVNRRDLLAKLIQPIFDQKLFSRYGAFLQLLARRKTSVEELIKAGASDELSKQLNRESNLFFQSRMAIADASLPDSVRFDAVALSTRDPATRNIALKLLAHYLSPQQPTEKQRSVINILAETADTALPALLTTNWQNHSPEIRSAAMEAMLRRESWAFELAQKVEAGLIRAADVDAARRNRLVKHSSQRVRDLAAKVFAQSSSTRAKVVDEFQPALRLSGNAAKGKEVYNRICVTCHKREGQGNEIGPDIRSVVDHAPEKLLVNILDPNADIQPGFHAYHCALANDEELYGLISAETATSVVFKFADGTTRTINRSEIKSLRSAGVSLMPEGLETGLNQQDVADLVAYLKTR